MVGACKCFVYCLLSICALLYLARNEQVVLSHFFADFTTHSPLPMTLEAARTKMLMHIGLGEVWICRVDGEIAGFCATGRVTPKTIAIRNVYVSPQYRRRGIADAMTRMLTRYLLGAEPLGFGGGLAAAGPPPSIKREVALNVALDYVEKIYKSCGFLLGEDDRDPESGKRGWFTSVFRGVRLLDSEVSCVVSPEPSVSSRSHGRVRRF